jgi:outer membrane lipoprotein SlyB
VTRPPVRAIICFMTKELLGTLLVVGMALLASACATPRPVLYPNARLEAVGNAAAQRDIDDCLRRATESTQALRPAGQVAGSTAMGAATGAAAGAAAGAVFGSAARGAASGAAGGGAAGLIRGLFHTRAPNLTPEQRQRVEQCLRAKGYEVSGWK